MKQLLFVLLFFPLIAFGQPDTLQPPYIRFPDLPPIQLLLADSITKYTKADLPEKKPVLLMLFSPDCSHCQHTAEDLHNYRNELKNIQVVMITMHSITRMKEFISKYRLDSIPELVVGRDMYYFMSSFYNIKNLPFMAFYNKKGKLISVFEGAMPLARVADLFKKNK